MITPFTYHFSPLSPLLFVHHHITDCAIDPSGHVGALTTRILWSGTSLHRHYPSLNEPFLFLKETSERVAVVVGFVPKGMTFPLNW